MWGSAALRRVARAGLTSLLLLPGHSRAEPPEGNHQPVIIKGQESEPLQIANKRKRDKGPILIGIGTALVYGLAERNGRNDQQYCSPQVRTVNYSNAMIRELVFGIKFNRTTGGGEPGSTLTSFGGIPVGSTVYRYFYQLATSNCNGLSGEVSVIRCKYAGGADCSAQVLPADFGAIPLHGTPNCSMDENVKTGHHRSEADEVVTNAITCTADVANPALPANKP